MRIAIKSVFQSQGGFETYHYRGDDGYPAAACFDAVIVETVDGRTFSLTRGKKFDTEDGCVAYLPIYDLDKQEALVRARGTIDPARWVEIHEGPSIEERLGEFGIEWQREQEERLYGSC